MSLDPSIDLGVDVLDEGPDDVEAMVIAWLGPLLPDGQVADARLPDDPLPFIEVAHLDGQESEEQSSVDELVSIHTLYPKGYGNAGRTFAVQFSSIVHGRMLLLARELEPVPVGGRVADLDYVNVFSRFRWAAYADERILHRTGRYRIGLSYARL